MSIIDRDISFYCGEKDRLLKELRECEPSKEDAITKKIVAVESIVASLGNYHKLLFNDKEQ